MNFRVFVSRPIPKAWLEPLVTSPKIDLSIHESTEVLSQEAWGLALEEVDGVLCFVNDRLSRALLQKAAKRLRVVSNFGVGFDNIDLEAANELGIAVTTTPNVLSEATAEMAWALLFAVARRTLEGDSLVRSGKFQGFDPTLLLGMEIAHKTLGLVGAGKIATRMATIANGFSLKLLYCATRRSAVLEEGLDATRLSLEETLKSADFLSLHVPLTGATRHLIDAKALALMQPHAILINTSRGEVVDEQALIEALKAKKIAGAGLDVYEHEPFVPEALKNLKNVVLTPHIGSATFEARRRMGLLASQNILDVLHGEIPASCVNHAALSLRLTSLAASRPSSAAGPG
jgi:glyoxylate reductase